MKYKTSDIAVVIPAFNCSATIINTLDRVFKQSPLPGEVIIVNDGSTDDTEAVIMSSRYFSLINYIYQDNAGPAVARNTAINNTEKLWVAFLDADDLWIDDCKLAKQIELANSNPLATLIDSFACIDWQGSKKINVKNVKNGNVFTEFLKSNAVNATSSVLAKTEIIKKVGGFNPSLKLGEDRLLWAKLAKEGEVHTLPLITVNKINEQGNLTSKGMKNYKYRLELVTELLDLEPVSENDVKSIWLVNLGEFMNLAFRTNNAKGFLMVFNDARKLSGHKVLTTKYIMLALYCKLFGTFKPFV
ncbi:UDP-Glc:alpha-D-GlcNAc-diphosphoundecaprenol beta-1,3-glucosyltransferase WfgD [Paraglaciecola mesophila]|uniref:UDP-Glc:alpha-D-GlcNAc-diphosphoundecaprenol beta-1,3-glucosyltransferase WfgD n=1 Tax=Paraglaciecola mesophila TaxID=197222 RepID=A0A857JKA1_9ALTE|nr:glycosyltransferase family A protein [Paraglaciecola mesophila]QHJ11401.1 UDP-Glc:alpha-D-GlcNAc-diphosphoundecaprenol beta-1,3-glucosyltransferase WfgD [Paraglaciecola mesophila]